RAAERGERHRRGDGASLVIRVAGICGVIIIAVIFHGQLEGAYEDAVRLLIRGGGPSFRGILAVSRRGLIPPRLLESEPAEPADPRGEEGAAVQGGSGVPPTSGSIVHRSPSPIMDLPPPSLACGHRPDSSARPGEDRGSPRVHVCRPIIRYVGS